MSDVRIADLSKHVGETVTLHGWLYQKRSSGKLHFLQVRDGTGIVQCVMSKSDVDEETFKRADHLAQETSLKVTGSVRKHPKLPEYELQAKQLEVVAPPTLEYPITPKEHGTAFL